MKMYKILRLMNTVKRNVHKFSCYLHHSDCNLRIYIHSMNKSYPVKIAR